MQIKYRILNDKNIEVENFIADNLSIWLTKYFSKIDNIIREMCYSGYNPKYIEEQEIESYRKHSIIDYLDRLEMEELNALWNGENTIQLFEYTIIFEII